MDRKKISALVSALIFLLATLCLVPTASAIRTHDHHHRHHRRHLLVGGGNANDITYDPAAQRPAGVTGPINRYTMPGTDVFVVDTTTPKVGNDGGVLSNAIETNTRNGDTHDLLATVARSRVTSTASPELRATLGSLDQQSFVQGGVNRESAFSTTRQAQGNLNVVTRGAGSSVGRPENRASLAAQDASSAVQIAVAGGPAAMDRAARVGAASANAVQLERSQFFTFVPTWW